MEKLLNESKFDQLQENAICKGVIVEIRQNEIIIDIGSKSEGVVPLHEFTDLDDLQVGMEIEVFLNKLEDCNGNPVISYDRALQKKNWEIILQKCQEGTIVSGRVKGKIKGGLVVSIGVDAFLPSSQVDVISPKNLDQYIGQTYDFKILKINTEKHNIILSRRELLEEQYLKKRTDLLSTIKAGETCRGTVKNITDYGAFVDLGGLDGLLHITDLSWGRVSHPNEVLRVGEEINVVVLDINQEKERVALGLKQLTANPWDNIAQKYPTGAHVRGKITNLVAYGAFLELEQGVEGLVHVTELSWTKRITKPGEVLKVGQEVEAVVLGIQQEEQKISLGMRQLEANPWEMVRHNYPVGARVRGRVRNLTTYGAFIGLEEGIDGMIHVSDMSWTRKINHPNEIIKKGQEIDAIVLDIDPAQQRIALGMKQLQEDPWNEIDLYFKIGDVVKGTVNKLTSYGAFVKLPHDIDGLVHISQVSEEAVEKIKDVLQVGQEVSARVVKVDQDERRIGLSIKAANYDASRLSAEIDHFEKLKGGQAMTNLGDILDEATN